jgi:hypothetical protein
MAARNHEIDCVLVWKFDRFARSTRHLLAALEESSRRTLRKRPGSGGHRQPDGPGNVYHHRSHGRVGVVPDQRARDRGDERMKAAEARGKHLGRPATSRRIIGEIEALAMSSDLSIRQIQGKIGGQASRGIVGEITKRVRAIQPSVL